MARPKSSAVSRCRRYARIMSQPPVADRTPAQNGGSGALPELIALGQGLAGASHPDTISALIAGTLRTLLDPGALLIVLADGDPVIRRVAYAHNIANPRPDDPLIEQAFKGPRAGAAP